jgi:signal peptidase I
VIRRWLSAGVPTIVALAATWATLRFLVPPGRESLFVSIVLFVLFAAVAGYWWRQLGWSGGGPPVEVSLGRAAAALVVIAALTFGVRQRLVEISRVTGASMEPTLNLGDRVVVNKLAYKLGGRSPRRGDLVVFANPDRAGEPDQPDSIVKRVIGLPGDEVSIVDGSPVINGWVVPSCEVGPFLLAFGTQIVRGRLAVERLGDRAYLTIRDPIQSPPFARFKVPPGELFVLGDDRPVSRDSRAWNDGHGAGVPIDQVAGRVSRLADLRHPFRGLRPELRVSNVDVSQLDQRIASCIAHSPRSSSPPAARAH